MSPDTTEPQLGLVTDLYELTMAASYRRLGMRDRATMSLYVRKLPEHRSYLVAAGIDRAVERLEHLGFDGAGVDYLVSTGHLRREDAEALARTRFTGDVRAVREGSIVFQDEPLLEVDAPIIEAQLAESLVLNAVHYPTLVASKAARCVAAARGRSVVEFGLRRAPGIEAGLEAARACFIAGFASTSNVDAGCVLGMPINGTVAHAFIEAMPDERTAFEAWALTSPGPVTLLVDTYDTLQGVRRAAALGRQLDRSGVKLQAVRLDSGDLDALSLGARRILDAAGLAHVKIFASGGLDEHAIDDLVRAGAPIDGFGVGTRICMSADAPVLDMAYKIVEYAGRPCLKLSAKKASLVGAKQVWRRRGIDGRFAEDRIAALDEPSPGGEWRPLLEPVVRGGRRLARRSIEDARRFHAEQVALLPLELRTLERAAAYPVALSKELRVRHEAAVHAARVREGLAEE